MKNIKLLDCTLRDGGYLNDWNFGHNTIISVFERLIGAGIDIIEVGFLNEKVDFDINKTIMPNTQSVGKIFENMDKGNTMVVGMIDFGTCGIENIEPCADSYLDGIRVIFKKNNMYKAMDLCSQINDLGYKVFAQLVSITAYSDEDLYEFVKLANNVGVYAVSLVDTYGLLHQENASHIFKVLDDGLNPNINIGYHAHNNFQMAYANCIEIINLDTKREIAVDGTIFGMGKSAGNAPLELLGMYLNDNFDKKYEISSILEALEVNILELQQKFQWGYSLFYYVSASNKCHPNYVSYLMNKNTLSMKSVNEILKNIQDDKKLDFDEEYIEELYVKFQLKIEKNDTKSITELKNILNNKKILLLGPGENAYLCKNKIIKYAEDNSLIVITINYICDYLKQDFLFLSNSKRYVQIASELTRKENSHISIIGLSNVTKTSGKFDYEIDYSKLVDKDTEIIDNSLVMFLKLLIKIKCKNVCLAGFDGYLENKVNYFNTNMEYGFVKNKANYLNNYAREFLKEVRNEIRVDFLTKSEYEI